jgi:hypothetical protein
METAAGEDRHIPGKYAGRYILTSCRSGIKMGALQIWPIKEENGGEKNG